MQRIKIYEKDNTTNQTSAITSRASVFVPGFAIGGSASMGELKECRSLSDFYGYFGSSIPKFVGDENYYPYNGNPVAVKTLSGENDQTLKAVYKAEDDAETGIALKLSNTKLYSEESSYAVGDQCLQSIDAIRGLYKCTTKIDSGEEWDLSKWSLELTENDVVELTKDPLKESAHTFYRFMIEDELQWANFKFLQVADLPGFPKIALPIEDGSDIDDYSQVRMFKDGDGDPSWLMAEQYLNLGLPVTYVRMNKIADSTAYNYDVTPKRAYEFLTDFFLNVDDMSPVFDKAEYNFQFLTSGGYPVLEYSTNIAGAMINVAKGKSEDESQTGGFSGRGDCLVLLDHTNNPYRDLIGDNSLFGQKSLPISEYAAVYTPWCEVGFTNLKYVPASFIYLYNVGSHINTGNSWNIYAGIGNGRCSIIKKLNTEKTLTNKIAEYYQNDYGETEIVNSSMNAITYIRNYGYCIWGNRTCERYQSGDTGFALSFVNIRNLVSEVKKRAYFVSQQLMFEVNDDTLWSKFRSNMATLLDTMKNGNGLNDYAFIKNTVEDKTKLSVAIILYPTYGVESVEVFVKLEDNVTTVEETSSEE